MRPDSIPGRLAEADGLVLASRAECHPFVLLEAMAAHRPVIAAATGGIPDLLAGGAGDLVPPGDAGALATALERWVDSPSHRQRLAERGWDRVGESYSIEESMQATRTSWAGLLGISMEQLPELLGPPSH